jgi:hypothetical protein
MYCFFGLTKALNEKFRWGLFAPVISKKKVRAWALLVLCELQLAATPKLSRSQQIQTNLKMLTA